MISVLESVERLRAWREANDPTWKDTLQPGLSDREIDRLAEPLAPFKLPEELRALYRWRNGETGGGLFDREFQPLERAIEDYQFGLEELDLNPLLFGFCDSNNDRYAVELLASPETSSGVFSLPHGDPDVYLTFISIERMAATLLRAHQEGGYVLLEEDQYWERDLEIYGAIRGEMNPGVHVFHEDERRGINVFDGVGTRDWPERWAKATGRGNDFVEITGERRALNEVVKAAREGQEGPFHVAGRILSLSSSGAESMYGISDRTAEVKVFCSDRASVRELSCGADVEAELVPEETMAWGGQVAHFRARKMKVLEHWDERRTPLSDEYEADRKAAAKSRRARLGALVRRVANRGGTTIQSSCTLGAAKTEADAIRSVELEVDATLKWLILHHGPFSTGSALLHAFQTHELTESYRIDGVDFDVDAYAGRRAQELFASYPKEAGVGGE